VRDSFFDGLPTDLDLATDSSAQEVRERCSARELRVIETGIQHGTVLVVIDGIHLEVTTFRQPADRETQVNARDIATDLSGRDFTINALAFSVASQTLIDTSSGVEDLVALRVKAVGDPLARFSEDPLRILRMIRFGPAHGRTIDPATLDAAKALVSSLERVSVERIREELEQILMSPCPAAGIVTIKEIGALPWTLPELLPAVGFEQNRYHIHDVFDHTMAVLDRTPADRILRWSAIFHDIGKPHTLSTDTAGERHFYLHEISSTKLSWERMEHLRFSHDDMKRISSVVRHHMRPLNCGPGCVGLSGISEKPYPCGVHLRMPTHLQQLTPAKWLPLPTPLIPCLKWNNVKWPHQATASSPSTVRTSRRSVWLQGRVWAECSSSLRKPSLKTPKRIPVRHL